MFRIAAFRPTGSGEVKAVLAPEELDALAGLPGLLRPLVEGDLEDDAAARLLPRASRDDPDVAAAYRAMAHNQLVEAKLSAIDRFETKVADRSDDRDTTKWIRYLDKDDVAAWMSVINDARLVLGTRLNVTDEGIEIDASADQDMLFEIDLYSMLTYFIETLTQSSSINEGRGVIEISRDQVENYDTD